MVCYVLLLLRFSFIENKHCNRTKKFIIGSQLLISYGLLILAFKVERMLNGVPVCNLQLRKLYNSSLSRHVPMSSRAYLLLFHFEAKKRNVKASTAVIITKKSIWSSDTQAAQILEISHTHGDSSCSQQVYFNFNLNLNFNALNCVYIFTGSLEKNHQIYRMY